jgi:HEAT repeat protein
VTGAAGAPELGWLVGTGSKKLRTLLRKPDQSKIHELLRQAKVFGAGHMPVVHPRTVRTLAPPLIAALDDTAEIVRANAAWLLGEFGAPEACEPLARVAAGDVSVNVRSRAVEALGWLVPPGAEGVPPLVAALVHSGDDVADSELRRTAARALARYGALDAELAPALLRALELELARVGYQGDQRISAMAPDWELAQLLSSAIAGIETAVLPALTAALASPRVGVRGVAVMALCRLIWRGEPGVAPDDLRPRLEGLLTDRAEPVRAHAAVALAALYPARSTQWLEALGEALTTQLMSATVRAQLMAIVRALGAAAMPLFPRMLAERTHYGGQHMRRMLLAALGLPARDLMAAAVERGEISPAEMAVWLAQVGAPDAFDHLSDVDPDDSGEATEANMFRHRLLARTGPRGVATVRELLADPHADYHLAVNAIRGLRAARADDREALLGLGLAAPSPKVRAMAAGLALAFGNPEGVAELERQWPADADLVIDAIATMKAPATAFVDRLLEVVEGYEYRYGALDALAVVAAALPNGPRRTRAFGALARAFGSRGSRREADDALARAGIRRGLEDPHAAPWDDEL